ncbi:MAG: aminodeoxychorismate synthase component I [Candidatus Omnitrophica bacterium]|nr:aminodeoxychorismate synthase component I [Candidatus Omnitrophota bacterium]
MDFFPLSENKIKRILTSQGNHPFVFLESARPTGGAHNSFLFSRFESIIEFYHGDDPHVFFKRLDAFITQGFWLSGYFAYEFGYYLEPSLFKLRKASRAPLAWLGVCKKPDIITHEHPPIHIHQPVRGYSIKNIRPNISRKEYALSLQRIKQYLRTGLTYQVNYTFNINFDFKGSLPDFYVNLRRAQPTSYMAFIQTGKDHILSVSPELFFTRNHNTITSRPMKGTMPKGLSFQQDWANRNYLTQSKKNRAENVMIVDLLRNDIGKISHRVRVPSLFETESYRTINQMVSTISGTLNVRAGMYDIFKALFPCGSVTGAPKIKTMELIARLEKEPRGIYTGAIGYISPNKEACFNVAIRSICLKRNRGQLGIGGGIVYDSLSRDEYREAILKARFLTGSPDFKLIETILWNKKYFFLHEHLKRLKASADYFSIPCDTYALAKALNAFTKRLTAQPLKIRVTITLAGRVMIEKEVLNSAPLPVKVKLSTLAIDPDNVFLYHKTTQRDKYERELRLARSQGFFEVIFRNQRKEVTEGSFTNVFIKKNKRLYTPPLCCGLLPGVLRARLLGSGRVKEKVLYLKDILRENEVYVGNSARGLLKAEISLADLENKSKIKYTP